jgi:hypothetical protein
VNCDLLADSHNIWNRWQDCISQLLNVLSVSDVKQTEIWATGPLIHDPSLSEVEVSITKVIKFRQNWFKQDVEYYGLRFIKSSFLFRIRKNCLISGRIYTLLHQFTKRVMKLTVVIMVRYQSYQHNAKCIQCPLKVKCIYRWNYWQLSDGYRSNRSTTDQIFFSHQITSKRSFPVTGRGDL